MTPRSGNIVRLIVIPDGIAKEAADRAEEQPPFYIKLPNYNQTSTKKKMSAVLITRKPCSVPMPNVDRHGGTFRFAKFVQCTMAQNAVD